MTIGRLPYFFNKKHVFRVFASLSILLGNYLLSPGNEPGTMAIPALIQEPIPDPVPNRTMFFPYRHLLSFLVLAKINGYGF
jgi:hypothetical protein